MTPHSASRDLLTEVLILSSKGFLVESVFLVYHVRTA